MTFSRFAVYVTLPAGPLSDFGSAWLGWSAATGERLDPPSVDGLPLPAHDITATPRKYGLHGTMKPPFRLAEGCSFDALSRAFASFCLSQRPVDIGPLALTRLGRFLALTPTGDQTALAGLAAACVRELDSFRAPASETELAKRRKARLSARQEALLLQWGYPYVMEEFRFHITLSGRLSAEDAEATRAALVPHIAPYLTKPFVLRQLTLCGEDDQGLFHELQRADLSG